MGHPITSDHKKGHSVCYTTWYSQLRNMVLLLSLISLRGGSKFEKCTLSLKLTLSSDPPNPHLLSVKTWVMCIIFLAIRETWIHLKASIDLLPRSQNVSLTLSIHFSNFDSPLIYIVLEQFVNETLSGEGFMCLNNCCVSVTHCPLVVSPWCVEFYWEQNLRESYCMTDIRATMNDSIEEIFSFYLFSL